MERTFTGLILLLFLNLPLSAQKPKGTGKSISVKVQTSFNRTVEKMLPTGHWTFTNDEGIKCMEGDYTVSTETSYKTGTWIFYNDDGIAFVKLSYSKDIPSGIEVLDSGNNRCGGGDIAVAVDTSNTYHVKCFEFPDIREFTIKKTPAKISASELSIAVKSGSKTPSGPYGLVVYSYTSDFENGAEQKRYSDSELMQQYPAIQQSLLKTLDIHDPKNLVMNPGMDRNYRNKKFPDESGMGKHIYPYWVQALASPDPGDIEGNNCIGFMVIGTDYEIIGGKLKTPLESNAKYCFQMKIRLKAESHYAVTSAGIILSEEPLPFKKFKREDFEENPPYLVSADSIYLALRERWQVISGEITANGGEQYFYLGVFPKNMKPNIIMLDSTSKTEDIKHRNDVYYYLDDVVLIPSDSATDCPCSASVCPEKKTETDSIKKTFAFKIILFASNSSVVSQTDLSYLDSLISYMEENPKVRLKITGHANDNKNEEKNEVLSEERAKVVYNYLVENGVKESRLEVDGVGSTEPVQGHKGKGKNRAVTFVFLYD